MNEDVDIVIKVKDDASSEIHKIDRTLSKLGNLAGKVVESIGSGLANLGQSAADFGMKMASATASTVAMGAGTTVASGGMNILVGVMVAAAAVIPALIAGFFALAPALLAIGGAAGAAVSGLIGVGVAAATLKIGLGGISDAWGAYGKAAGGGGASSAAAGKQAEAAARQVEQAEKSLTRAKRDEVKAAEEVNRARKNEIERLEDLQMALRGTTLDQKQAILELDEAKKKALFNSLYGNEEEKRASELAVEQAQYQYDSITEKLGDLQAEKEKADKAGVEGSDQVKAALERQSDAQERTKDAAEALAVAQEQVGQSAGSAGGGVDQFAEAMSKLSPNAQKLVMTLISVKERFDAIKKSVQDRLLDGISVAVEDLASKWLPRLEPMLGSMADKLNSVAKAILKAFGDPTFISNIEKTSKSFETFLESLGVSTTSLIDAFGRIGAASGPVLKEIGAIIEDITVGFADWIKSADDSGGLESFMEDAAKALRDIYDIGKEVFTIVGQVIGILFPGSQAASDGLLDTVKNNLKDVSDWLGNTENQKKLQDFVTEVGEFFEKVFTDYIPQAIAFAETLSDMAAPIIWLGKKFRELAEGIDKAMKDAKKWISDKWDDIVDYFGKLPGRIGKKTSGMWNGIKESFRSALNWIVDKWNGLELSLPSVNFLGQQIGGGSIGTPDIDHFAQGGVGGGLAMVGEQGRELVRLPYGSTVIPNNTTEQIMQGNSGGTAKFVLDVVVNSNGILKTMQEEVRVGGGLARVFVS
jgi:hypothetical protein